MPAGFQRIAALLLMLLLAPLAMAAQPAFYVSPAGSDSYDGSAAHPWRTIQHAAVQLRPGQTAIVAGGKYDERVSITSSGAAGVPIVLQAAPGARVMLRGFNVSGSNWVIRGFDISSQANGSNGYGVFIHGSAAHDRIENNYIHELCHEGIFMAPSAAHNTIRSNRIWRAAMAGIFVDGTSELVERNEVWGTQQYPERAGGIYSSCITPEGADADGIRFFGQHNIIRSNYLHGIVSKTKINPGPHIDCFQTWGSSAMTVDDILIESNFCRWPLARADVDDSSAMIEGREGAIGTITFRNNVFTHMRQGINLGKNVAALRALNNTWAHIVQEAIIFYEPRTSADRIINNIFYDVGGGGDSYMCLPGGNPVIANNVFFMPRGEPGTYCSSAPYLKLDPMFVNAGDSADSASDFRLRPGSPLLNRGVSLPSVTSDFAGNARPAGVAYAIGAFQQ